MAGNRRSSGRGSPNDCDNYHYTKLREIVFCEVRRKIKSKPDGIRGYLSNLRRISAEAKAEYLNLKRASISETEGPIKDKDQGCDNTNGFDRKPSIDVVTAYLHLFLLGRRIVAENSNSCDGASDINLIDLVFSYVLEAYVSTLTPQGKEQIYSLLQRISLEAIEGYLNMKRTSNPTKGLLEDKFQKCDTTKALCQKPPTHAAFASSSSKKSKYSFKDICEDFLPSSKLSKGLPEGLLLAQSIYCAEVALASYNEKHGTEYKLVEPLASARLRECGMRFHCNFTASKLKRNGSRTAQPKLFFANFQSIKKRICDMHCSIIDPAKAEYMCCEDCPPDLAHCGRRICCYDVAWKYLLNQKEYNARKNKVYAEIALDIFNNKHGTKYKLVKSLESNIVPVSFGVYKFHCNFKAKLENPDSSDDASPKLFFGDIVKSTILSEGECYVLDDTEGLVDHCSICRQGIFHPAHFRIPAIPCD